MTAHYATWSVWLLAPLAWNEMSRGTVPDLLYDTSPFWLSFEFRRRGPGGLQSLARYSAFFGGCLAISSALAAISTWGIRAAMLRQDGRTARRITKGGTTGRAWSPRVRMPGASLDGNPVLWREWHRRRSSAWSRAIWRLYASLSAIFTIAAIGTQPEIAPGVGASMVSIGLLMVSVTSATALAEERTRGSLDILLATPLSTRAIVLGKWWGTFRVVPGLAILPGALAFGSALRGGGWEGAACFAAPIAALVLAYGAAITSLGLALATWQPRLGRAVGLSVAAYLATTVVYPMIALMTLRLGPDDVTYLWVSPFFGMFIPMGWTAWGVVHTSERADFVILVWAALISAVAFALLQMTLASFDRRLGRIPDLPG